MKTNPSRFLSILSGAALILCLSQAVAVKALPVDLGAAGDYAILETGAAAANANVSLAAAPPSGAINGNIGMGSTSGNLSVSAGNLPINGNVYLASGATSSGLSGNVTGTINQNYNLSAAISAAAAASLQASGLASSLGGVGFTTINTGGGVLNLTPGVYNLADFKLGNGTIVNLAAGGSYVFNIKGTLSLNSAEVLAAAGLSDANILFNVEDSQGVAFSGGMNNECVLDGIILADDASVSLTPGAVNGEIIAGNNINVASGGSVAGGGSNNVPDSGPTFPVLAVCLLGILGAATIKARSRSTTSLPIQ